MGGWIEGKKEEKEDEKEEGKEGRRKGMKEGRAQEKDAPGGFGEGVIKREPRVPTVSSCAQGGRVLSPHTSRVCGYGRGLSWPLRAAVGAGVGP